MSKFIGNIVLKGKLICKTGMHIGGSKDKLEIGGVDSPVIRDPFTKLPYIPGSSLKGKMRSLLAFALDKLEYENSAAPIENQNEFYNNQIIHIFGVSANSTKNAPKIGPTRLVVRDAHPDQATIEMWKNLDTDLLYTEYKPENTINRLTSAANPRFIERVVKGSAFDVEFVFGIYRIEGESRNDESYFTDFISAIKLLESSYLGGSGSRGYGQIEFKFYEPFALINDDYHKTTDLFKASTKTIDTLVENKDWKHLRASDFTPEKIENIISVYKGK